MRDRGVCRHCRRYVYLSAATGRWLHGDLTPDCRMSATKAEPLPEKTT